MDDEQDYVKLAFYHLLSANDTIILSSLPMGLLYWFCTTLKHNNDYEYFDIVCAFVCFSIVLTSQMMYVVMSLDVK